MTTQSITWRERRDMSWPEFDAFVDAETDRWIAKFKQSGYMTRNREQTRANIVRGLMIGTYELGSRAGVRAYTGVPDYSKIEVQTEYESGRRRANVPALATER